MQQLPYPPIVLECPECGEKYLISNESNQPSENAIFFSDGFYIDNEVWRTPGIIGCVTCELGFCPVKGKIIATPIWEEFYKCWAHLKKAEPPTAGSLALELRTRRNMEIETEKLIRKEFWYSVNHSEAGKVLMETNEKFKSLWNNSLIRYEELIDLNKTGERIIKAEINRNLGRFETCLSVLEGVTGHLPELIRQEAFKERNTIFQL
jgi:hypothetical protein